MFHDDLFTNVYVHKAFNEDYSKVWLFVILKLCLSVEWRVSKSELSRDFHLQAWKSFC